MAGLLAASALAVGPTTIFASDVAQVDTELNQTYQQVMQMLPAPRREQLRKSERAWLTFTQLNKVAFQATASRLGLSQTEVQRTEVDQLRLRVRELREMLSGGDSGPGTVARFRSEDGQLNIVYQRCVVTLPAVEVMKLRDAQRAWLSFRDASQSLGADICWRITSDRIDQLNNLYIGPSESSVKASPAKTTASEPEDKRDSRIPDPFERARP